MLTTLTTRARQDERPEGVDDLEGAGRDDRQREGDGGGAEEVRLLGGGGAQVQLHEGHRRVRPGGGLRRFTATYFHSFPPYVVTLVNFSDRVLRKR